MKTAHVLPALLACLAPLAACESAGPDAPLVAMPQGAAALSFTHLGPWYYSGMMSHRREVVTDRTEWQLVWVQIQGSVRPPAPLPPVDFGEEMVVVVAMGGRSSGGYSITVTKVAGDSSAVYVEVLEQSPGSGCGVTAALTQPVDAVVIPGGPFLPVRFVERQETRDCR